jgi:hypothetical protein
VFIGVGALFIGMGMWNGGRTVANLHNDHLEMKVAPLAARQLLLYKDVDSLDEQGPKKVFITAAGKRTRLPLAVLEDADQPAFVEALKRKVAQHNVGAT